MWPLCNKSDKIYRILLFFLFFVFSFSDDGMQPFPLLSERDIDRNPIVIEYDISQLIEDNDIFRCIDIDQTINWEYASEYVCDKYDILTDEKLSTLYITIQNLTNYFAAVMKVNHEKLGYVGYNDYSNSIRIQESINNISSDHRITILVRPFGDETVAHTKVFQYHKNGRPLQSILILNPRVIPRRVDKYFFLLLFHETVHSLGLNEDTFPKWIDRKTGFPYQSHPIVNLTLPQYNNKQFYELCTPKAKEVFKRRSGFQSGCLPMEESGEPRDIRVHVKGTFFKQDVLAAMVTKDAVISEISLAIIEDMGWYTVDWDAADPMTWGTVSFNANKEFFERPSWKNIPDEYKFVSGVDTISIDYRSYGRHKSKRYDSQNDEFFLMDYNDLYLPTKLLENVTNKTRIQTVNVHHKRQDEEEHDDNDSNEEIENQNIAKNDSTTIEFNITRYATHDYMPLQRPTKFCKSDEWAMQILIKGEKRAACLQSSYNLTHITFVYNGVYTCASGEKVFIDPARTVVCPNVTFLKKVADFFNTPPRDYGHIPLPMDQHVHENENNIAPLHDDVPNPVKFIQKFDSNSKKKKSLPPPTEVKVKRKANIADYYGFIIAFIVVGCAFALVLYLSGKDSYSKAPVALSLPMKQQPIYV